MLTDLKDFSLREYLIGQALAGMSQGLHGMLAGSPSAYARGPCNSVIAERVIALADAVLKKLHEEKWDE